jgi:hypothetical protein
MRLKVEWQDYPDYKETSTGFYAPPDKQLQTLNLLDIEMVCIEYRPGNYRGLIEMFEDDYSICWCYEDKDLEKVKLYMEVLLGRIVREEV